MEEATRSFNCPRGVSERQEGGGGCEEGAWGLWGYLHTVGLHAVGAERSALDRSVLRRCRGLETCNWPFQATGEVGSKAVKIPTFTSTP